MSRESRVAGVDGCTAGWIIATLEGATVVATLDLHPYTRVGIDMPIGLDDSSPRACDIEARRFLGRRGSCVFPAPPRACLPCIDYASALSTARSATGRGISMQTYNIMRKVAELDDVVDPAAGDVVIEVHPECAFKMINGGQDLPSKKTVEGRNRRRDLLRPYFRVPGDPPRGATTDDLLDAYAVLWSTMRFDRGEHIVFGDGRRDGRGIEMRIVC